MSTTGRVLLRILRRWHDDPKPLSVLESIFTDANAELHCLIEHGLIAEILDAEGWPSYIPTEKAINAYLTRRMNEICGLKGEE